MPTRAFICGCAGFELTQVERTFLRESQPWGLILFRRNVETPAQVARLVAQFRECVGRTAPVLIDQEGGRVQRLGPPHWRAYPSAARLAQFGDQSAHLVTLAARLMAHDLAQLGINIDCLPVLDVPAVGGHAVIGDRAYGDNAASVAMLGRAAASGLMAGGVLPVMKHIPGHGRAGADTHLELPVVATSRAELERSDFAAFRACRDLPMAMTAHVVYSDIDPSGPATTSALVVQAIIRDFIGFDGLLISDDLSMKALSGTFTEKTARLFAAGVDMALHCNGDIGEALEIVSSTPVLQGKALQRADSALAQLRAPEPFDPVDAAAELLRALAVLA